jgi:hypothetical protein
MFPLMTPTVLPKPWNQALTTTNQINITRTLSITICCSTWLFLPRPLMSKHVNAPRYNICTHEGSKRHVCSVYRKKQLVGKNRFCGALHESLSLPQTVFHPPNSARKCALTTLPCTLDCVNMWNSYFFCISIRPCMLQQRLN